MKNIQVEIGKSNMLPLLASQRFYESWKVFIRELLINAIDACNVRRALEWSWGTEFLEMEQADKVKPVRPIYEPQITITYSSDSRILTIEDNGIGINEYDLENYVSKVGASYYTSRDFFDQKLEYEPMSRYGLGLCSCFTVSKAILIESKKDPVINTAWNVGNPQSTEPVMAKWFGDSNHIDYVISQKKTEGTRITIPIKPAYAPYIDTDFIVDTIRHYMLAVPIPINIRCDANEICLDMTTPEWNYPLNDLVGMNVIHVDTELLEGYVAIYHPKHRGYFEKSMLYQQDVLVTESADTLGLTPSWLDNFSYQLNIKNRLLTVNISRDGIARDEKLAELRQHIGQILIDYYGKSPLTLGQYLTDGRSRLVSEYEAENELISRAIRVLVYLKEREVEVPVKTVINGFMGRKIKIAFIHKELFAYYRQNYPYDYGQFVDKYDMIIFEPNIRAFWQFIAPYITSMEYIMEDMPGIVYTDVAADLTASKAAAAFRDTYLLRPHYYDIEPVFCMVSNELTDPMELVINRHNRNAMLLERAKKYPKVRRFQAVLIENIKQRILGNAAKWDCIIDFGGELLHEYDLEKPMSLQAVWCLERDFADEINAFVSKTFTPAEMAEYGLTSLFFTKEDFIKWWISP